MKPSEQAIRTAAREQYALPSSDDIEVPHDAAVDETDDGWWVEARVWVPKYHFDQDDDSPDGAQSDRRRFAAAVHAAIADGFDVQYRPDYSGRGMLGRTCPAVTGADSEVMAALAEHGAGDLLRKCSRDSMGLGVVLYLRSADQDPET